MEPKRPHIYVSTRLVREYFFKFLLASPRIPHPLHGDKNRAPNSLQIFPPFLPSPAPICPSFPPIWVLMMQNPAQNAPTMAKNASTKSASAMGKMRQLERIQVIAIACALLQHIQRLWSQIQHILRGQSYVFWTDLHLKADKYPKFWPPFPLYFYNRWSHIYHKSPPSSVIFYNSWTPSPLEVYTRVEMWDLPFQGLEC